MITLDKVFLGIVAAVLLAFAGLFLATLAGNSLFVNWLQSANFVFEGGIPALILILLAVYLVVLVNREEKKRYVVYEKELGAVRVSTACIESLIIEAARELPGIKEVGVRIVDVEQPKVSLSVQILPDYNIPQLTEELQGKVKEYVEDTVGVAIQEIEIVVVGIGSKDESALDSLL